MPALRKSFVAVPLAVLGTVLGLASLFGEWSRAVMPDGTTLSGWTLLSLGVIGLPYAAGLIALLAIVVVTLSSHRRGKWRSPRVAGLVVCALSLALLAVLARMIVGDRMFGALYYRPSNISYDLDQILGWGLYAAFGALIALGAALMASAPVRRP